jgi:hypothetical protein
MDARAAARIAVLKDSPGWTDLAEVLAEVEKKRWDLLVADLKAGKDPDASDIAFCRGISHGIRILTGAPEKAVRIYERQKQEASE